MLEHPGRILMTVDSVGGVWRHAVDAARDLGERGVSVVLAGLGPEASPRQVAEVRALPRADLVWLDAPLDWMVEDERALDGLPGMIARLIDELCIDLVHLNTPTQAVGLDPTIPVVVMSHSCVVTWWDAVKGGALPPAWAWQHRRNRQGLGAADAVIAPSAAHASAVTRCFGLSRPVSVVHNAARPGPRHDRRRSVVLAAGRWWDEGKNGRMLDDAAAHVGWPVELAGSLEGPSGQAMHPRHARPLGSLSPTAVREEMARAAIVTCPSLYEPFGLAALEAAHAGAALVLADIPTFREIWGGAALFADPRDPDRFASALQAAIDDPDLRARLAEAAARRARQFDPGRQIDGLLGVYRRALAGRGLRKSAAE